MLLAELGAGVAAMARSREPDRYLSALLAPRAIQGDLVCLAAFAAEVGRIPSEVSDANLGEIRLQWWRDSLDAIERGDATGHPSGDAIARILRARALGTPALGSIVDATSHNLYTDPFDDDAEFLRHVEGLHAGLFASGLAIAMRPGSGHAPEIPSTAATAARAYGIARVLRELPYALSRERVPLPLPRLQAGGFVAADVGSAPSRRAIAQTAADLAKIARDELAMLRTSELWRDRQTRVALLPVAMVEPNLRAFEQRGRDSVEALVEPSPLRRVWRLWCAYRFGVM